MSSKLLNMAWGEVWGTRSMPPRVHAHRQIKYATKKEQEQRLLMLLLRPLRHRRRRRQRDNYAAATAASLPAPSCC